MTKEKASALMNSPYFLHKNAEDGEELLRQIRGLGGENVGRSASMVFLVEAHPEKAEEWERRYGHYLKQARAVIERATSDHVGWNDYWMSRWLILGDDKALDGIIRQMNKTHVWVPPGRNPQPGIPSVGDMARWMVNSMKSQCPEFARRLAERMYGAPVLQEGAR